LYDLELCSLIYWKKNDNFFGFHALT